MDALKLRAQFELETGYTWTNSQGEPDIDYVAWLENKVTGPSPAEIDAAYKRIVSWYTEGKKLDVNLGLEVQRLQGGTVGIYLEYLVEKGCKFYYEPRVFKLPSGNVVRSKDQEGLTIFNKLKRCYNE